MCHTSMSSAPGSASGALACCNRASGMKYMLAMLCSKPAAMKAEIGNTMAMNLSVTLRPAYAIHTAMHTSTLHSMPRKKASISGIDTLAAAIFTACCATPPPFMPMWPERNTSAASPQAPMKLARHTIIQFFSTSAVLILRSAHAIASKLLPVNSSAPATTTSSRPSEKHTPPRTREAAKPSVASLVTSVK